MKKLNVAIIGQGRSGKDIHGKYYLSADNRYYTVKYVVEADERRRRISEKRYPDCRTFADYTALFDLTDIDLLDDDYRKRIRLIPVTRLGSTHIVTGVRADSVTVSNGKRCEEVSFTVGIDNEEGTYGGYEVLAPYAAMKNVF